jgi:acetoin utilization deacetylase AcuC-like enzyme
MTDERSLDDRSGAERAPAAAAAGDPGGPPRGGRTPMIPVFYTRRQSLPHTHGFSPSAGKPALVVAAWEAEGFPIRLVEPARATYGELCSAHDERYVEDVLAGRIPDGFGTTRPEIRATLHWTVGSMVSAARHAASTGESAFSPTSGFHHACWDRCGGFCTFNGLAIAALAVRSADPDARVAVIDCDQHLGNGTADIIERLRLGWVRHYTYGARPPRRDGVEEWLAELPGIVADAVRGCAVALYQAGADPHHDDPLGGVLTSEQLAERDRIVFQTCLDLGVPVVTNLAGGYQRPVERVVAIHVRTMREFVAVHAPSARAR